MLLAFGDSLRWFLQASEFIHGCGDEHLGPQVWGARMLTCFDEAGGVRGDSKSGVHDAMIMVPRVTR
eukprot:4205592-Amphidinium_carterae.1